jgi:uncharacterized protein YigA (DUF484 family)
VNEEPELVPQPLPTPEQVSRFLRAHPRFVIDDPDLLEMLELNHASGSAVSLIERQIELLRGRNQRLGDRLELLVDAARENELRIGSHHRMARLLIRAPTLAAVVVALRTAMRDHFDIEYVFLGISTSVLKRHDIDGVTPIEPDGPIAKSCDNLLRTRLIECGPLDEARARLLFPKVDLPPRSAAIAPLEKDRNLGIIAFASSDPVRFQPRQGKLFVELAAELAAAAIRARLT